MQPGTWFLKLTALNRWPYAHRQKVNGKATDFEYRCTLTSIKQAFTADLILTS